MNAELKRREHVVILDVTECLMAEEVIFCHNTNEFKTYLDFV
jgi:hypothetical protein